MKALLHRRWLAALLAVLIGWTGSALAHEGHSHGDEPVAPANASPRAETRSELFELVGIVGPDGALWLYLDRAGTTEPIDNATIDAQLDGREVKVRRVGPATYTLTDSDFASPGSRNIVFTVTAGLDVDLLPMTIEMPSAASAAAPAAHSHGAVLAALRDPFAWAGVLVLLLIGGLIGRFSAPRAIPPMIEPDAAPRPVPADVAPATQAPPVETRKTRDRATAAVAVLAVLTLGVAAVAQPMDQPRRQPDGSVFVPKPTQRLLRVRTTITERSEAPVAVQFTGQIVADPNASGRVQAPQAGRVDPPPSGFPTLGSQVQRGQVLAYVMPILTAQERSATQANLAELNAQIGIAQQRVQRFAGLVGSVSTREINEARAELDGLRARREAVAEALEGRRPVEATAAGVLSSVNVGSGQIVDAREPLFEIVDPARLWVEAIAFDGGIAGNPASAEATAPGGAALRLEFVGRGLSLRQQAIQLQFRIVSPPAGLALGTPVTVIVQTERKVEGIVLPADAVVRSSEGPPVILEMPSAERFVPHPVRVQPLDASRVLVTGGLEPGRRVVTEGAGIIAQIR